MPRPVYINLLRDPLRMQVSAFYFWRACVCRTRQAFCAQAWKLASSSSLCKPNYTIDDLYMTANPVPAVGLMTRWFCGHSDECAGPEPQPLSARQHALHRALSNMRLEYVWVGVLERLDDSLRLLTAVLPAFFGGMVVERSAREHVRPQTNASHYTYARPTRGTLHKLAIENENDISLYQHAIELLDCRLERCGFVPNAKSVSSSIDEPQLHGNKQDTAMAMPVMFANSAAVHLLRRRRHLGS